MPKQATVRRVDSMMRKPSYNKAASKNAGDTRRSTSGAGKGMKLVADGGVLLRDVRVDDLGLGVVELGGMRTEELVRPALEMAKMGLKSLLLAENGPYWTK